MSIWRSALLGILLSAFAPPAHAADNSRGQARASATEAADEPSTVKASGTVDTGTRHYLVEFLQDGDQAALRVRAGDEASPTVYPLGHPSTALMLLADRRVSFLWQPLLEWAGPSLDLLRSRGVVNARAAFEQQALGHVANDSAESVVRRRLRAVLQFAKVLELFGYTAEALDHLRAELGRLDLRSQRGKMNYSVLMTDIAGTLRSQGDLSGALAFLTQAESVLAGSPYAANPAINRAAFLAQAGNYAEALAAVTEAMRLNAVQPRSRRTRSIRGSDRHFAWIRACALNGLGRTAEAEEALAPVLRDEEVRDRYFIVEDTRSVRFRAFLCMRNVDALVREVVSSIEAAPFAPVAFVALQPARRYPPYDPDLMARIRADPRVEAVLRDRMRVLPAELELALNSWGTPGY